MHYAYGVFYQKGKIPAFNLEREAYIHKIFKSFYMPFSLKFERC